MDDREHRQRRFCGVLALSQFWHRQSFGRRPQQGHVFKHASVPGEANPCWAEEARGIPLGTGEC